MQIKTGNYFSINNLTTKINTDQGIITAVDNLCLNIERQEIFGLVGESGCGKNNNCKIYFATFTSNCKNNFW